MRRVKKTISQADIGINSSISHPILVSEELTRSNQELLFQERSLRSQGNYKFVWSFNGQVLARYRQGSKVIRIIDSTHVNELREGLSLEPISDYPEVDDLNIMHWNINHLTNKLHLVEQYVVAFIGILHVIAISET